MGGGLQAKRFEYLGRRSTLLSNGRIRAAVDAVGGMMPEFSLGKGRGGTNAHWLPEFRDNSGRPYSEAEHARYWKAKILYLIAGDFPCCPNFGGGGVVDGAKLAELTAARAAMDETVAKPAGKLVTGFLTTAIVALTPPNP